MVRVVFVCNKFAFLFEGIERKSMTHQKEASSNHQVRIVKGYQIVALLNILLLPLRKPPHHVSIPIATTPSL